MARLRKFAIAAMVVAVMCLLPQSEGFPLTYKAGVGIKDMTGDDIWVHCQSKEDNFDPLTLHNNQVWKFRFEPEVGSYTYYWCDFKWGDKTASFPVWSINVAPVYDFSICDWKVEQQGFSLYNPPKSEWLFKHQWGDHEAAEATDEDNVVRVERGVLGEITDDV